MPLKAKAKAGFYPAPPKIVQILESSIGEKKPGPKRLLDPCCGAGKPAAEMSAVAEWEAYGVEIHQNDENLAGVVAKALKKGTLEKDIGYNWQFPLETGSISP
ncbi:MAG: hypothetical protein ACE5FB_06340 [Candidatus Binatia bacterium]